MKIEIRHSAPHSTSYRAERARALFNLEGGGDFAMSAELPLDKKPWKIGLILGPSGSGKTSIAREIVPEFDSDAEQAWPVMPILDALGPGQAFETVTGALTSAGLSNIPAWLRPYTALSVGEKFRADLARVLLEGGQTAIIDEFSSTVDRATAKSAANAFGKAWRKTDRRLIAVSCHGDIVPWLRPCWIFDTAKGAFQWRLERRRPRLTLDIFQTDWRYWPYFEPHHYLKLPNMIASTNYVGFIKDEPVVHLAVSPMPGLRELRAARFVVRPEWQGLGIGMRFLNEVAAMIRRGRNRFQKALPTLIITAHPGLLRALKRDANWHQINARLTGGKAERPQSSRLNKTRPNNSVGKMQGHFRATCSFRYVEPTTKNLA